MKSPHRLWLVSLAVSLSLHVALVLALWLAPITAEQKSDTVHDTTITETGIQLSLVFSPKPSRPPASLPLPPDFEAKIIEVPPVAPTPPPVPEVAPPQNLTGQGIQLVSGTAGPGPSGLPAPAGPAGSGTAVGLFQVPSAAQSVVFVIDRSISMGPSGALATAQIELLACLRSLPATTRFQVIPYNRRATPLQLGVRTALVPAEPALVAEACRQVLELSAEGGTDHVQALRRGLALRPQVLWFATDNDDLTLADVRQLTAFNQNRTALHVLELSQGSRATNFLERLARENGGTYRRSLPRTDIDPKLP